MISNTLYKPVSGSALDLRSGAFDGGYFQRLFLHTTVDPVAYINDGGQQTPSGEIA